MILINRENEWNSLNRLFLQVWFSLIFQKNLKTKLTQNDFKNKILVEEFSLADEHQKIIRKLKARQEKSKLTKNKCNDSILKGLKTLLRSKSKNEQNLIKKTENNRNGSVTHFQVSFQIEMEINKNFLIWFSEYFRYNLHI